MKGTIGALVGVDVGALVGADVGALVGADVGALVGADVGALVGADVGALVGAMVGVVTGAQVNGSVVLTPLGILFVFSCDTSHESVFTLRCRECPAGFEPVCVPMFWEVIWPIAGPSAAVKLPPPYDKNSATVESGRTNAIPSTLPFWIPLLT